MVENTEITRRDFLRSEKREEGLPELVPSAALLVERGWRQVLAPSLQALTWRWLHCAARRGQGRPATSLPEPLQPDIA